MCADESDKITGLLLNKHTSIFRTEANLKEKGGRARLYTFKVSLSLSSFFRLTDNTFKMSNFFFLVAVEKYVSTDLGIAARRLMED